MTDKQKAIIRYRESDIEKEEQSPLERLRFFCQLAMSGDDWLDAGHFFDSLALQVRDKVDVGPWSAGATTDGRAYLESSDFTHDVRLYVDGDFAWPGDKLNYAQGIAQQLNADSNVAVTWDESMSRILAVTRQDSDGQIISVIAVAPPAVTPISEPPPEFRYIAKGDLRLINGQWMTCTDPEIGRWQGSGPPAPRSQEAQPDEYVYFEDWYSKDAPDESEVRPFDMARHAWLAGIRFAELFPVAPVAAPVSAEPVVARDLLRRAKMVLQLVDKDKGSTICTGGLISDISTYLAAPVAAQAPGVEMVPPATSRDRWMYQQGRLAERDPRTPGSLAAEIAAQAQTKHSGIAVPCPSNPKQSSDRDQTRIMDALRNAKDERQLAFSAKEVRGLLNTIKNQQTRIERFEAKSGCADLIRFDYVNADGQPDSKMITHDEMRERYAAQVQPGSDRAMMESLMRSFDMEVWNCPNCTATEETKDCDSAIMLREYLANNPVPAQQPVSGADGLADVEIDIADVRQYLQSWGCLAHPGVRALVDGYQSSTQPSVNSGELPSPDCLYETTNERTGFIDQEPAYRATTVRFLIEQAVRAALAQQDAMLDSRIAADMAAIVETLDEGEWAEHIAKTDLGQRLERHITQLVGKQQDSDKVDALPPLNDDLIAILGRPNFKCIMLANALRDGGMEIARCAKNEQAAAIHFLLGHYLADPEQWVEKANAALRSTAARKEQE